MSRLAESFHARSLRLMTSDDAAAIEIVPNSSFKSETLPTTWVATYTNFQAGEGGTLSSTNSSITTYDQRDGFLLRPAVFRTAEHPLPYTRKGSRVVSVPSVNVQRTLLNTDSTPHVVENYVGTLDWADPTKSTQWYGTLPNVPDDLKNLARVRLAENMLGAKAQGLVILGELSETLGMLHNAARLLRGKVFDYNRSRA